ncbi:MAG: hypothetical protein ABIK26_06765 [Candidatus Omnitrophota bacterium]
MKNKRTKEATVRWRKLCESISKKRNPFAGMTKEQVIKELRKTREKLWEEKLAARS